MTPAPGGSGPVRVLHGGWSVESHGPVVARVESSVLRVVVLSGRTDIRRGEAEALTVTGPLVIDLPLDGGARAALSVSAVSSAWLDRSNCTAIPARALADLRLGWSPRFLGGWGATLEVTNLLDQRTASQTLCNPIGDVTAVTAPIQDFLGYPLPGRAVFGGVVYEVR